MKIAWYTPFSVRSAIGRFSALVIEQLVHRGCDVTIVRSETYSREIRQVETIHSAWPICWAPTLEPDVTASMARFDLVVYNIGNHYAYHEYCFHHAPQVPGLVILHDNVLHHALHGYCEAHLDSEITYERVLEEECGSDVVRSMLSILQGDPDDWWQRDVVRHPVLRWALKGTHGVVVHSQFAEANVRDQVACPCRIIPLAYNGGLTDVTPRHRHAQDGRLRLLTVGHVNRNKRAKQIVEVLAADPQLKSRCDYRIVGPFVDRTRSEMDAAIAHGGLAGQVTLTGHVDAQQLQEEFARADVILCLRNPAMEGGSASVIEGLLTGKPVIVSDTGCYAEIPDELVYKVGVEHEAQQLTDVLHEIIANYDAALRRAEVAREWARQRHAPQRYAHELLSFLDHVLYDGPVLRTVDRVGACIADWQRNCDSLLLRRIDRVFEDLFREGVRSRRAA